MSIIPFVSASLSLVVFSSVSGNCNTDVYNQVYSTYNNSEYRNVSEISNPSNSIVFFDYSKYKQNVSIIEDYSLLQDNWNGYGALQINKDVISTVNELLSTLIYQPDVFPTGRGGIQIEYQKTDDSYLEFEFFPNGQIGMLKIDSNQNEEERFVNLSEISTIVGVFNAV